MAGAMTSGPMPSPASTAMWKALFADMGEASGKSEPSRHCERSEAIQNCICGDILDCFVASLLAMTEDGAEVTASAPCGRPPPPPAPTPPHLTPSPPRVVGWGAGRPRPRGVGFFFFRSHEIEQLLRLAQ